ncbi:hypothetical protein LTR36_003690 [Oleoguttula mirabilis]|uniref:MOSC domain-containing protein n=1 Tax=Oleoguttula mirabilis TaxID=1507867 RepID=A0AAV9JJK0_9PEZI|nr:hypothetical protein LTR36_003690 [Oleoguttula mirabilis]
MKIAKLSTYPIKSLRATELDAATLTKHGFTYDRRYMILKVLEDGSYENMAVASYAEMTLFFTSITIPEDGDALHGTITITFKPPTGEQQTLEIPLKPKVAGLEDMDVIMHRSPTKAHKMNQEYNDWLSACFGFEVVLAYLGDNLRNVLMSTSGNKQEASNGWFSSFTSKATQLVVGANNEQSQITFADCAPYLIVSEKSMEDVHSRLPDGQQMDITKFRPNIVVSGADEVWEEDFWGELTIGGETKIQTEHNCARCKSINIDYATGQPGTTEAGSILKKLNSNRRVDPGAKWSPIFGRYSFLHPGSEGHAIKVGDEVRVSKRNAEGTRFDWEGLSTN